MNRRRVLSAIGAVFAGSIGRSVAADRVARVALLTFVNRDGADREWMDALVNGFAETGYRQGDNLRLQRYEVRVVSAMGWDIAVPNAIARIIATEPDCIIAMGEVLAGYVRQRVRTTPVVTDVGDPVGLGLAATLLRPGGNFTGLHSGYAEVATKQVELLRTLVPALRGVVWIAFEPQLIWFPTFEKAAQQAGLAVRKVIPPTPSKPGFREHLGSEFAGLRRDGFLAGHFHSSIPAFIDAVTALAIEHRIALSYSGGDLDREGLLLSYGIQRLDGLRSAQRMPAIVARILRGERPGDIPFEGPTGYRLELNLKTAARIGLTVPPEVLVLADEIIR
jgi:putative ABC transport system substrate-binding protein